MFGKVTKFHGSGLIEAELIASSLPGTMPLTSDGIDNLGSGYTLAPGSTMYVTGIDKRYILGTDSTWSEMPGSGGGSTVTVTQIKSSGEKIATITVDGVETDLYASTGGSGGGAVDSVNGKTGDVVLAASDVGAVADADYVHTDNNYTTAEKTKLLGIAAGAEVNVQPDWSQTDTDADDYIKNKPTIPTVTGKADKVASATSGNFAGLDSNGNLTDSGKKASDFQMALTFDSTPTENSTNPVTSGGVYNALAGKQDSLTFDSTPTPNSTNPVKSDGIYTALSQKQDLLEITTDFDLQYRTSVGDIIIWNGTEGSFYKQGHLYRILSHTGGSTQSEEVSPITFDSTPTSGSTNAVTSGGVYAAIHSAGGGADIGDIKITACSTAPSGWLICDGSTISRTTYANLFEAIGTTYGAGDGSTTFKIPDLRGKTVFGKDGTTDFNTLGKTGGAKTKTLTTSNMPSHTHGLTNVNGQFKANSSSGSYVGLSAENAHSGISYGAFTVDVSLTGTTGSAGSGSSFSILNPYMALNYIIYAGV